MEKDIHYFHLDHNAPCLPPRIFHNHCFQFLQGITVVPGEIENNGYAKFSGVNKVHCGLCEYRTRVNTASEFARFRVNGLHG